MNTEVFNQGQENQLRFQVSNVKLRIVEKGTDGLLAWAACVIAGAIKLDNIAIRRSRDGSLFLTYPAKRDSSGDNHQYFHPISVEASRAIQDAILARLASLAMAASENGART
jgi:DNA-binding cell septation regulator SpoVG